MAIKNVFILLIFCLLTSLYTICSAPNNRQTIDLISFIKLTCIVLTLFYSILFIYSSTYVSTCHCRFVLVCPSCSNNLPLVGLIKLPEEEDYLVSLAANQPNIPPRSRWGPKKKPIPDSSSPP